MGYIRSSIRKQKDDNLWYVEIVTTWLYFGEQVTHTTKKTLSEARAWLLEQRCYNLKVEEDAEKIENQDKLDRESIPRAPTPILNTCVPRPENKVTKTGNQERAQALQAEIKQKLDSKKHKHKGKHSNWTVPVGLILDSDMP